MLPQCTCKQSNVLVCNTTVAIWGALYTPTSTLTNQTSYVVPASKTTLAYGLQGAIVSDPNSDETNKTPRLRSQLNVTGTSQTMFPPLREGLIVKYNTSGPKHGILVSGVILTSWNTIPVFDATLPFQNLTSCPECIWKQSDSNSCAWCPNSGAEFLLQCHRHHGYRPQCRWNQSDPLPATIVSL